MSDADPPPNALRDLPNGELRNLRELLTAKIDAVSRVIDERDRFYKERDEGRGVAVAAALTAAKEQTAAAQAAAKESTKAAFEASEKAIVKAEEAQRAYNTAHNDLARKMDEQNKATMPRPESENRFQAVEKEIGQLRVALSEAGGVLVGSKKRTDDTRANIAIVISVVMMIVGIGIAILRWR